MSDFRTCNTCGEEKPLDAFRENPKALGGRIGKCTDCFDYSHDTRGPRGYIDEDAPAKTPRKSASEMIAQYGLSAEHVIVAWRAAERAEEYREWYRSALGEKGAWESEGPDECVDRMLAGRPFKLRKRVCDLALTFCHVLGVDMTSRTKAERYRRTA